MSSCTRHGFDVPDTISIPDPLGRENITNLRALIALNFYNSVFAIRPVGAAGPAFFLQQGCKIFEKQFVLWKPIDHGHSLSAAALFFDPKYSDEFKTFGIHLGNARAFRNDFLTLGAYAVQSRVCGVDKASAPIFCFWHSIPMLTATTALGTPRK